MLQQQKIDDLADDCRKKGIEKAEAEANLIDCIQKDRDMTRDWSYSKRPCVYDTELADITMVAIARGTKKIY